jgi:hypothetical protein
VEAIGLLQVFASFLVLSTIALAKRRWQSCHNQGERRHEKGQQQHSHSTTEVSTIIEIPMITGSRTTVIQLQASHPPYP